MTYDEIEQRLTACLINQLGIPSHMVSRDAEFRRDMGLTSLDAQQLCLFVHRTYGLPLTARDWASFLTLNDLIAYIHQHQ